MATADLGWCIARCKIKLGLDEDDLDNELTICSPKDSADGDVSITLVGLESIIALRELINEEIAEAEERRELAAREVMANGA